MQKIFSHFIHLKIIAAIVLAECIADNHMLVRVDLRDNARIGSAGLLALHLAMKMNTSITLLNLDYTCTNSNKIKVFFLIYFFLMTIKIIVLFVFFELS